MKNARIKKALEKLEQVLEEEIAKREETFDSRSEKWQESDNGLLHRHETEEFEQMLDSTSEKIQEFES